MPPPLYTGLSEAIFLSSAQGDKKVTKPEPVRLPVKSPVRLYFINRLHVIKQTSDDVIDTVRERLLDNVQRNKVRKKFQNKALFDYIAYQFLLALTTHKPLNNKDPFSKRPIDPTKAVRFSTGHQVDCNSLATLCTQKHGMTFYAPETGNKVILSLKDEYNVRALHFKERYNFSKQMKDFLETTENFIVLGGMGIMAVLMTVTAIAIFTSPLHLGALLPIMAGVGACCVLAGVTLQGVMHWLDYKEKKQWFSSQLERVKARLANSHSGNEQQALADDKMISDYVKRINEHIAPEWLNLFRYVRGKFAVNVNSLGEAVAETSFSSPPSPAA